MEFILRRGISGNTVLRQFRADTVYKMLHLRVRIESPILLGDLRGTLKADGYHLLRAHIDILYPSGIGVFLLIAAPLDIGEGYYGQADEDPDFPTTSSHCSAILYDCSRIQCTKNR